VRLGRPAKVDDAGVATRERLLAAASAACVENGFEGATLGDIARRADVSAPAIYNHFGDKAELMVAAAHAALSRLGPSTVDSRPTARASVRAFLADDFASTRRLLAELHLAAQRHPELAALLAEWHTAQAAVWRPTSGRDRTAVVKVFFAFLLGLCQVESLSALDAPTPAIRRQAEQLAAALFPEEEHS
jgi:AcrR family transcriptional regulator